MTNQSLSFEVRGWKSQKISLLKFVINILSELKVRISDSISRTWISDQCHKFRLERAGSKKVYMKIRSVIETVISELEVTDLLQQKSEFNLKTQVKRNV